MVGFPYIYSGIKFSDSKRTNHVRFWFHIHSIFHIHSMSSLIELDYGKIYRKALYLMVKTMVSCRFSQQNQSSESREPLARSFGFHSWGHLNRTLASMASRMPPELVQDGIHRTKTPDIQRIGSLKVVSLADFSDSEKTCSICIAASVASHSHCRTCFRHCCYTALCSPLFPGSSWMMFPWEKGKTCSGGAAEIVPHTLGQRGFCCEKNVALSSTKWKSSTNGYGL